MSKWTWLDKLLYNLGAGLIHSLHGVTAAEHHSTLAGLRAFEEKRLCEKDALIEQQRSRIENLLVNEALQPQRSTWKRRDHCKKYLAIAVERAFVDYFSNPELSKDGD